MDLIRANKVVADCPEDSFKCGHSLPMYHALRFWDREKERTGQIVNIYPKRVGESYEFSYLVSAKNDQNMYQDYRVDWMPLMQRFESRRRNKR